jgi:hypothetical protein
MTSPTTFDRDERVRAELYRAKLLVNRTPHLERGTRREANRALDALEAQLGLNRVNVAEAARAMETLIRAHASIAFGLLRNADFVARFAPALRNLGLRGLEDRLDEVPSSVLVHPIPGPTEGRHHRDELPAEERVDAEGRPLPPPPGFY